MNRADRRAREAAARHAPPTFTEEGRKAAALYRANLKLQPIVRGAYRQCDEYIATHPARGDNTCTKGCNACCNQLIHLDQLEAIAIIDRHPDAVRRALPKLKRAELLLEHVVGLERLEAGVYGDDEALVQGAAAWFRAGEPCALLGDDGLCTVYEARPWACRVYYVATPPEWCADADRVFGELDPKRHVLELEPDTFRQAGDTWRSRAHEKARGQAVGTLPAMLRATWEVRETLRQGGR